MSEAAIESRQKMGGAGPVNPAQPREDLKSTALSDSSLMEKTFFIVRDSGGKRHEVKGRLVHIRRDPGGYLVLTYLDRGVWVHILTTPYDLEIATGAP